MFEDINPGFQDPDFRIWIPDFRIWILDFRIRIVDFRILIPDFRISIPDPGVKKLWIPDPESKHCTAVSPDTLFAFNTHCLYPGQAACCQDLPPVYSFIDTGANHKVSISPNFCKYL
jgi:hypothetical protein